MGELNDRNPILTRLGKKGKLLERMLKCFIEKPSFRKGKNMAC